MVSKELLELDKNTVQFMIDEMQDEIDGQKVLIQEMGEQLQEKDNYIAELKAKLAVRLIVCDRVTELRFP